MIDGYVQLKNLLHSHTSNCSYKKLVSRCACVFKTLAGSRLAGCCVCSRMKDEGEARKKYYLTRLFNGLLDIFLSY